MSTYRKPKLKDYEFISNRIIFQPDGKPIWMDNYGPRSRSHTLAGTLLTNGYRKILFISFDGYRTQVAAHRLRFFMEYDFLPEEVDHINHDRDDNRIENLRGCTRAENGKNISIISRGNSQYKGVFFCGKGKKWRACIRVDGERKWLGSHISEDEAARAYNEASLEYHGEYGFLNDVAATAAEIPEPKRVFKDGAFYPVIHTAPGLERDVAEYKKGSFWVTNSDLSWRESEFSWIGEELKIEWGES